MLSLVSNSQTIERKIMLVFQLNKSEISAFKSNWNEAAYSPKYLSNRNASMFFISKDAF